MTNATLTTPGGGLVLDGARRSVPASAVRPFCGSCGLSYAWGGHRLCWCCWQDPLLRGRFPDPEAAASLEARAREAAFKGQSRRPPARPTDAPPGSAAKLDVLAARAAANELLFHPADARGNGGRGRLFVSDGPAADGGWPAAVLATAPGDGGGAGRGPKGGLPRPRARSVRGARLRGQRPAEPRDVNDPDGWGAARLRHLHLDEHCGHREQRAVLAAAVEEVLVRRGVGRRLARWAAQLPAGPGPNMTSD